MSRVNTTHLIDNFAILQGEDYLLLVEQDVIKIPGDWTTGTPRGDLRDNTADKNGLLYAQWQFEASTFDGTDTILHPFLDSTQTVNVPATKYREGQTPNIKLCLVTDFEVELPSGVVGKTPPIFVQVVGEITRDGSSITPLVEDFYLDRENHRGTQLAVTISDFDIAVENNGVVAANTNARHSAVTVANNSDVELQLTNQELTASIVDNAITVGKLNEEITTSLVLANNALQPDEVGVTIQPYDANLVSDANYVATENSYTTVEKNKLAGIESGATADQTGAEIKTLYEAEVDTNAYTDVEKTKLAGIADGAEVNVNADWNAISGDAQILNKPTLGTAAATDSTDYATAAQGALADTALQPNNNETIGGNYTFNGALILPNNSRINGFEHFYQTTKPTTRGDGSSLVVGDIWYKPVDNGVAGTAGHWIWTGSDWVSSEKYLLQLGCDSVSATTTFSIVPFRIPDSLGSILVSLSYSVQIATANDSNYWGFSFLGYKYPYSQGGSVGGSFGFFANLASGDPRLEFKEPGLINGSISLDVVINNRYCNGIALTATKTGSPSNTGICIFKFIFRDIHP